MTDPDLQLNVEFPREFDVDKMIQLARRVVALFLEGTADHLFPELKQFAEGGKPSGDHIKIQSASEMHLSLKMSPGRKFIIIYPHNFRLAHPEEDPASRIDRRMKEAILKIKALLMDYENLEYVPPRTVWP